MRDDKPKKWSVLAMVGYALLIWVAVKAYLIGYYPDQVVAQMIVPGVIGAALVGLDRLRSRQEN